MCKGTHGRPRVSVKILIIDSVCVEGFDQGCRGTSSEVHVAWLQTNMNQTNPLSSEGSGCSVVRYHQWEKLSSHLKTVFI